MFDEAMRQWFHRADPVPFAEVINKPEGLNLEVSFCSMMLVIFSLVAAFHYFAADTVFQQIAALLIWIGNSAFWGVFIIAGTIGRQRRQFIYSEPALNLERNIERLEKMQEQARVSAVQSAVHDAAA